DPPVPPAGGRPWLSRGRVPATDRPRQWQRTLLECLDYRPGPGPGAPRRTAAGPALSGRTATGGPPVFFQRSGWPAPEPVAGSPALPGRHERRPAPPERRAAPERPALHRLRLPGRRPPVEQRPHNGTMTCRSAVPDGGRESADRPPPPASNHGRYPPPYTTSMAAIRPVSIWSMTWQWNIHTPGLSATRATRAVSFLPSR